MSKAKVKEQQSRELKIGAAELFAALSYNTDITPTGCRFHTWRVALVAQRLAAILSPAIQRDVFYAGLMQDVGTIGSYKHISEYDLQEQVNDRHIRTHPERGAVLLELIPGMSAAAQYVRSHHEWWNGKGYPCGKRGHEIPLGAQILRLADEANTADCFTSDPDFAARLRSIASLTGHAWSKDIWASLVSSTSDAEFYRTLMNPSDLPGLMSRTLKELNLPSKIATEPAVEKIIHVFAALTDAKDPAKNGHAVRVARYAQAVATQMKLSVEDQRTTYRAGLVHDCGRVAIPSGVLLRSGRLVEDELEQVRKHAHATIRVFSCIPNRPAMSLMGTIAGGHHERLDGAGYPNKLSAEDIHPVSKILAVADAFDAMVSVASYRMLTPKCAMMRLQQSVGTQFDPAAVAAMDVVVKSGDFREEMLCAA